ncbi:unnamed protein product [Paramecium sonneborni]|uniref:Uncharacterized protein n=1 Tax=Paramecium sonneborni TaxID=65129 RepID=A0A8S1QNY0_9CILI|nr:unnamed protein product [Paramecium sonneborni]
MRNLDDLILFLEKLIQFESTSKQLFKYFLSKSLVLEKSPGSNASKYMNCLFNLKLEILSYLQEQMVMEKFRFIVKIKQKEDIYKSQMKAVIILEEKGNIIQINFQNKIRQNKKISKNEHQKYTSFNRKIEKKQNFKVSKLSHYAASILKQFWRVQYISSKKYTLILNALFGDDAKSLLLLFI